MSTRNNTALQYDEFKIDNYNIINYKLANIFIIENILDDTFCDTIIDLINTIPLKKADHEEHQNTKSYRNFMGELLDYDDNFHYFFSLNEKDTIKNYTNHLNGITRKDLLNINNLINHKMKIANEIIKKITEKQQLFISLEYNSGYEFRKIYGNTRKHCDGAATILKSITNINDTIINNEQKIYKLVRTASIIFALNENYNGGIFTFSSYNISLKLKKGSILIFPPYWTHPHEVSDLKDNTFRYTINTWAVDTVNQI